MGLAILMNLMTLDPMERERERERDRNAVERDGGGEGAYDDD